MPYPTKEEFVRMLETAKHEDILRDHIFGGTPYAFRDNPSDADLLYDHLSAGLLIPRENLTIIGSGKIGFSLAPDKFGIAFRAESDIDVVVVSESIFDAIWFDLLRFPKYRLKQLREWERARIDGHRNEIYWGRVWPHQLIAVSSQAKTWRDAFRSISRIPQLAYHEIRGRLYRTWEHARMYHLYGLRYLKYSLMASP